MSTAQITPEKMATMVQHSWKYGTIYLTPADLDTRPAIEQFGEYSEAEVDVFRHFVRPGSIVIDAGALWGCHALALASLGATVHAFEPQYWPWSCLRQTLLDNSLTRQVKLTRAALGERHGMTSMPVFDPVIEQHYGLTKTGDVGQGVMVFAIDDLQLSGLDFLKIDVEGDEPKVLLGAMKTLQRFEPPVYLEFQFHQEKIMELFRQAGYVEFWKHSPPRDRNPNFFNRKATMQDGAPMLLALAPGQTMPVGVALESVL